MIIQTQSSLRLALLSAVSIKNKGTLRPNLGRFGAQVLRAATLGSGIKTVSDQTLNLFQKQV